ncbi:retrovirus-related pol polyprotein from transposon TNT 1-94 [Tanacetum coccineum]
MTQELTECKSILAETSRTLGESNSIRDSCLVALQNKQTEFERYKAFNDRTVDYDKLERKLNETLGLLAQKDIDIQEGLKVKAYEISVVQAKHDELVKQSLLTRSHYEGLVKEKTKEWTVCTQASEHTDFVSKEIYTDLLRDLLIRKTLSSLEIALQECQVQLKNDTVCKERASNVFRKEREQYVEIQDLKAQMQDKNMAITMQAVRNTNVIKPGMYRIASSTTQTRAPQLNQTFRNTNPRASTSTGVAHKTNVSRPQPRSNQIDKIRSMPNISCKLKKTEVEEHPRISSISNKTKSVTACNDSLNSRTLNANVVCATCGKCVFNLNHDACVSKFLNDVNARTKKPNVVPISTRKPKVKANKSVATPHKKTVASEPTITSSKSYYRMLYKKTSKAWKWWIAQQCPSTYKWVPKTQKKWVPKTQKKWVPKTQNKWVPKVRNESDPICHVFHRPLLSCRVVQPTYSLMTLGCTKHMTGNVSLLCNFVEKYLGTVRFGNDQFAPILGYGDLVQGNITIKRVYYVEGLNHNLFSVGSTHDADYGGGDFGNLQTTSSTPICLLAKASPTQAWLWHRRLSHLNFDYINLLSKKDVVIGLPKLKYVKDQLCSSCEVSKAKRSSFKSKTCPSSKDETPEVLKDFLTMIQRNLQALVISVRTDRGTEFLNKTLNAFFKEEGIEHQTSTPRTPKQERHCRKRNALSLRLLERCFQLLNFLYSFGLKQSQPHAILKTDQSSSQLMRKRHITSLMTENPQSNTFTSLVVHLRNNVDQADYQTFCTPVQEIAESSSRNIGTSNMHTFNQPQDSEYRWTKDHPLTQVRGNPSKPVQTRRQLATDPEMCMFALTVSTAEPKNIKEAMADSAG